MKRNEKMLKNLTAEVLAGVIARSGKLVACRMLINGGETLSVVAEKTGASVSEVESLLKQMVRGL